MEQLSKLFIAVIYPGHLLFYFATFSERHEESKQERERALDWIPLDII